jgi:hypothetical protein
VAGKQDPDVRLVSVFFRQRDRSRVSSNDDCARPLAKGTRSTVRSTWEVVLDPTVDRASVLPRKEVIQPHLPVRLPCYDFVPITDPTFDGCLLAVGPPASGVASFHDVTGGVYKAREHIHRRMLTGGY